MKIQVPHQITTNRPGAYLVGGSVRDLIRGMTPVDYDLAVPSDPRALADEIAIKNDGRVIVLGKDRFTVYRVAASRCNIDITTYKGRDIRQDLLSRDFTINALACDLIDHRIIDETGGLVDLHRGLVRMISPAAFQDDPARLIRAFRMAAVLDFRIEPETVEAIGAYAGLLGRTAGERVWTELAKILACPGSHPHLQMMADSGILGAIIPELNSQREIHPEKPNYGDGLVHALQPVEALERILRKPEAFVSPGAEGLIKSLDMENRTLIKMSLLLHTIGKSACRRKNADSRTHYHGYAARSAQLAQSIGRRLRMSNRHRERLVALVHRHQRPFFLFQATQSGDHPPPKTLGRFFMQCGELVPHLLIQAMAVNMSKNAQSKWNSKDAYGFLNDILSTYLEKTTDLGSSPILNGRELISRFELQPSPLVGTLLRRLEELRLAGMIVNRQQALEWVMEHLERIK